jgi:hypothetical protein
VAYVIRHHKAKRLTNREFYVARFLPVRLGHVLFKYLVYIRRMADLLHRERLGINQSHQRQSQTRLLFHCSGRPWPTSCLTNVLTKATLDVWRQAVNARMYRQLAIAVTEKHVREVYTPFNRYDDCSSDADINVIFAWQSGHRPLQRGITYGLDGAYPFRLQPSLLRAYEWASMRWHEFLHQPSKSLSRVSREAPSTLTPLSTCRKRAITEVSPDFVILPNQTISPKRCRDHKDIATPSQQRLQLPQALGCEERPVEVSLNTHRGPSPRLPHAREEGHVTCMDGILFALDEPRNY